MKPDEKRTAESAAGSANGNEKEKGYRFNTFSGVFLPSILTILGVVMFMRLGVVTSELGIVGALGILLFAESIALATGLSISAISTNTMVIALGAGLGVWGVINLLEGYGNDNPGAKSQGMKQLMAGGGVALIGITLVPLLSGLFG